MSVAQLTLPLPAPRSRNSDPESSSLAADSVAGSQQQSECRAILEALRTGYAPRTYRELHRIVKHRIPEPAEVNRRLDDLRKAGLVRTCERRACRVSGRLAQTWEAIR